MRVIKFRGMGIDGAWHAGNLAIISKKVDHIEAGSYISNSAGIPFAYQVRPETVGMFTGLLDKNGKEIYEGDLVRIVYTDWPSKSHDDKRTLDEYLEAISEVAEIFYRAPSFYASFEPGAEFKACSDMCPGQHGLIWVIGTIYENPELL